MTHACAEVSIARRTAYNLRDDDDEFAGEWEDALDAAVEDLEKSAFQKAKDGWLEPVYYKGKRVGWKNRYAPSLAMWMLSKLRPEVYNLPTHDPLKRPDGDGYGSTSVFFYEDADEARAAAEAAEQEATA